MRYSSKVYEVQPERNEVQPESIRGTAREYMRYSPRLYEVQPESI